MAFWSQTALFSSVKHLILLSVWNSHFINFLSRSARLSHIMHFIILSALPNEFAKTTLALNIRRYFFITKSTLRIRVTRLSWFSIWNSGLTRAYNNCWIMYLWLVIGRRITSPIRVTLASFHHELIVLAALLLIQISIIIFEMSLSIDI